MNLDPLAAVLCGVVALCLFALHIVTSPHRHHWMTLPEYVRRGLWLSGAMFTWRSVNFISQPPAQLSPIGHINAEGMLALVALTYTAGALTLWAVRKVLPGDRWSRLHWLERKEREDPSLIPLAISPEDVVQLAKSKMYVNGEAPTEPPKEAKS